MVLSDCLQAENPIVIDNSLIKILRAKKDKKLDILISAFDFYQNRVKLLIEEYSTNSSQEIKNKIGLNNSFMYLKYNQIKKYYNNC
jgi:hypothetical protein